MARPSASRAATEQVSETPIEAAMPAPSSGLFNPDLALAPVQIARDMAIGWLECCRLGLAAGRAMQDDMRRAMRSGNDAALSAAQAVWAIGAAPSSPAAPLATQEPLAANDAAPQPVATRALAPASFWLSGAQALTPFATQLGGPWWSALLDHDRRPQA